MVWYSFVPRDLFHRFFLHRKKVSKQIHIKANELDQGIHVCFLVFSKFFTDVLESQREGLLFHLHTFPELSLFKHFFYLSLVFTTTAISICKYNLTCFLRPCGIFPNKIQQESKLIFELVIDLYLIS